jgi:L-threonylcarbamoyladenylate synthase
VDPTLSVDEAAAIIGRGGVLVIPTETVYGLAVRPDAQGVERIFEIKDRPQSKSLQLLIPDASFLDRLGHPSANARVLADTFWPGPLTIVVPSSGDAPDAVTADGTIGLRVPAHPLALDLLAQTGPLAASSANRSGEPTRSTVKEIRAIFGTSVDGYLDGEYIDGPGSTVVSFDGEEPIVLRAGVLSAERIAAATRSQGPI